MAMAPDALLADPELEIILNLTPPGAHRDVTRAAIEQGKHVYSEKPLAMSSSDAEELLGLAEARGVRIGCAPDIFLGGAYQEARALIDQGAIGTPLAVSATMLAGGQETWHPDPDIFYRDGAGPLARHGAVLPDGDRGAPRPGPARRRARFDARHGTCDRARPAGRASASPPRRRPTRRR